MRPYAKVVLRPIISEKTAGLKETQNKVVFEVAVDANKVEVAQALEQAFKVKVADVNIVNVKGKVKRLGRNMGRRRSWKKAIVTLKEGSTIEFFDGV